MATVNVYAAWYYFSKASTHAVRAAWPTLPVSVKPV
jgi:hypothetical protein